MSKSPLTVDKVEADIASDYKKNPQDLSPIFKELNELRKQDGNGFTADLAQINADLVKKNILPGLEIDQDPTAPLGFKTNPISDAAPVIPPSSTGSGSGDGSTGDGSDGSDSSSGGGGGGGGSSGGGSDAGSGGGGGSGSSSGGGGDSASSGGSTYDGASASVDEQTLLANVKTVAAIAKSLGVDPTLAVADMLVESGGNNDAIGDKGDSVGLFQLNIHGEGKGMSVAERENPVTNAETALKNFARYKGISDPGTLAATAENPTDHPAYAQKVDNTLPRAKALLAQAGVKS